MLYYACWQLIFRIFPGTGRRLAGCFGRGRDDEFLAPDGIALHLYTGSRLFRLVKT